MRARWTTWRSRPTCAPTSGNFLPSARSVIVMGTIYNTDQGSGIRDQGSGRDAIKVARYARGQDYHKVIEDRLLELIEWMKATSAGPVRRGALRRQAPGAGTRLRASRRRRLDRQELLRDQSGAGFVDVPVGHRDQPRSRRPTRRRSISAARARSASTRVRPARSSTRARSMRPDASRISRSKPKGRFRRRSARRSASTRGAATSARTCARGISPRQ